MFLKKLNEFAGVSSVLPLVYKNVQTTIAPCNTANVTFWKKEQNSETYYCIPTQTLRQSIQDTHICL